MEMLKTLIVGILLLSLFFIGQIFRLWWRLQRKKGKMQIISPAEKKAFRRSLSMGVVFFVWVLIVVVTVLVGYI